MSCIDAGFMYPGEQSEIYDKKIVWEYWLYGVTNVIIAGIGIFLNLLGVLTLFKNKDRSLFHNLMLSLFFIDTIVLITTILTQLQINIGSYSSFISYVFPYFSYPLKGISIYASVWMTIFMSFERYQALKNPVEYRHRSAKQRFQKRRLFIYLCCVLIISILFNITAFMEYEVVYVDKEIIEMFVAMKHRILQPKDDIPTGVEEQELYPFVRSTESEDTDSIFRNYIVWSEFVLRILIPMILIVYFNGSTFYFMNREKRSIRDALGGRKSQKETENKIKSRELKMGNTFLAIIVSFILCYLPCYVSSTIHALEKIESLCPKSDEAPQTSILPICCYINKLWFFILFYLGNVLITLNSSINVLLYGFTGKKFRIDAKEMLYKPFQFSKCCSLQKLKTSHSVFRTFSSARSTKMTTVPATFRKLDID